MIGPDGLVHEPVGDVEAGQDEHRDGVSYNGFLSHLVLGPPRRSNPAMCSPSQSSVDVIIPNWNGERCIAACLASLTAQTHPNLRVMVVDNGSTDRSLQIVRDQFPQVSVIEVGVNGGFAAAVNRGIRATRGDYVALLNNDAVARPEWLAKLAQALDADPALGSCASRMLVMNKPWLVNVAGLAFSPSLRSCAATIGWGTLDSYEHHAPYLVAAASGGAVMYRRQALDEVGLFDEDYFMFSEETDWLYRFRQAGWEVWFTPEAEVVHLGGASHGGKLYVENLRGILRFMAKNRGPKEAARARLLLLWSLRLRALVFRGDRGESYREGVRFLASGDVPSLLE